MRWLPESSLGKAIWDNWSADSFLLTFLVVGVLLIYEPMWVEGVTSLSADLKAGVIEVAKFFGSNTLAGVFAISVADTAIAWGAFMLLTRVFIITFVAWLAGKIAERIGIGRGSR